MGLVEFILSAEACAVLAKFVLRDLLLKYKNFLEILARDCNLRLLEFGVVSGG